jgi:hypothetical protein
MLRDFIEDEKWAALVMSAIGGGLVVGFAAAFLLLW